MLQLKVPLALKEGHVHLQCWLGNGPEIQSCRLPEDSQVLTGCEDLSSWGMHHTHACLMWGVDTSRHERAPRKCATERVHGARAVHWRHNRHHCWDQELHLNSRNSFRTRKITAMKPATWLTVKPSGSNLSYAHRARAHCAAVPSG